MWCFGDRRVGVKWVSCGTNQKPLIYEKMITASDSNKQLSFQLISVAPSAGRFEYAALLWLWSVWSGHAVVRVRWGWRREGIHPRCSALTLMVFTSMPAYCNCWFKITDQVESTAVYIFSGEGIVKCEAMGLKLFFFLSSKKCLLEQFNCFLNSRASLSMLCIPPLNNRMHSWRIKVISIRIT